MHSPTEKELEDTSTPGTQQDDYLIIRGDVEHHNLSSVDPYYSAIHSDDEAIKDKYDTVTMLNERSMTEKELLRFVENAEQSRNRGIYQKIRIWAEDSYHYTLELSKFSLLLYAILLLCFGAGICVLSLNVWKCARIAVVGFRTPIYDCSQAQFMCDKCSCNCIRECGASSYDGDIYRITVESQFYGKDDYKVDVSGSQIKISAEKSCKEKNDVKKSFSFSANLPSDVDPSTLKRSFANGQLVFEAKKLPGK